MVFVLQVTLYSLTLGLGGHDYETSHLRQSTITNRAHILSLARTSPAADLCDRWEASPNKAIGGKYRTENIVMRTYGFCFLIKIVLEGQGQFVINSSAAESIK